MRQGADVVITIGEMFIVPLRMANPAEFGERVMDTKEMSLADARDLLKLALRAQPDGALRGTREGPRAFYDEDQLAAMLRVSVPTFVSRWKRWQAQGWVTTTGRPNRGRLERWLLVERDKAAEVAAFVSSGGEKEAKPASTKLLPPLRKSNYGVVPRARGTRVSAPQSNGVGGAADCLHLGLDMLARGIPVQIVKPPYTGTAIEARRDTPDVLMRMLGSNNPDLAIAALISDKPSPGVLSGMEQPRISARRQRENPIRSAEQPLMKVLAALEDHGFRPMRKGNRWHSRCPSHERSKPDALEVYERADGKVNIRCFKDCDYTMVLGILGLSPRNLYPVKR